MRKTGDPQPLSLNSFGFTAFRLSFRRLALTLMPADIP
jgi:succinate-acetate transporter protein